MKLNLNSLLWSLFILSSTLQRTVSGAATYQYQSPWSNNDETDYAEIAQKDQEEKKLISQKVERQAAKQKELLEQQIKNDETKREKISEILEAAARKDKHNIIAAQLRNTEGSESLERKREEDQESRGFNSIQSLMQKELDEAKIKQRIREEFEREEKVRAEINDQQSQNFNLIQSLKKKDLDETKEKIRKRIQRDAIKAEVFHRIAQLPATINNISQSAGGAVMAVASPGIDFFKKTIPVVKKIPSKAISSAINTKNYVKTRLAERQQKKQQIIQKQASAVKIQNAWRRSRKKQEDSIRNDTDNLVEEYLQKNNVNLTNPKENTEIQLELEPASIALIKIKELWAKNKIYKNLVEIMTKTKPEKLGQKPEKLKEIREKLESKFDSIQDLIEISNYFNQPNQTEDMNKVKNLLNERIRRLVNIRQELARQEQTKNIPQRAKTTRVPEPVPTIKEPKPVRIINDKLGNIPENKKLTTIERLRKRMQHPRKAPSGLTPKRIGIAGALTVAGAEALRYTPFQNDPGYDSTPTQPYQGPVTTTPGFEQPLVQESLSVLPQEAFTPLPSQASPEYFDSANNVAEQNLQATSENAVQLYNSNYRSPATVTQEANIALPTTTATPTAAAAATAAPVPDESYWNSAATSLASMRDSVYQGASSAYQSAADTVSSAYTQGSQYAGDAQKWLQESDLYKLAAENPYAAGAIGAAAVVGTGIAAYKLYQYWSNYQRSFGRILGKLTWLNTKYPNLTDSYGTLMTQLEKAMSYFADPNATISDDAKNYLFANAYQAGNAALSFLEAAAQGKKNVSLNIRFKPDFLDEVLNSFWAYAPTGSLQELQNAYQNRQALIALPSFVNMEESSEVVSSLQNILAQAQKLATEYSTQGAQKNNVFTTRLKVSRIDYEKVAGFLGIAVAEKTPRHEIFNKIREALSDSSLAEQIRTKQTTGLFAKMLGKR